jgi:hypothetical protein
MKNRLWLIIIIVGILALFLLALTDTAGATPLAGTRGGCPVVSQRYGLACTVQDAGVGWVSGTCQWGEYFLAQTARVFVPGQAVTVTGCVDDHGALRSVPGFALRISKR